MNLFLFFFFCKKKIEVAKVHIIITSYCSLVLSNYCYFLKVLTILRMHFGIWQQHELKCWCHFLQVALFSHVIDCKLLGAGGGEAFSSNIQGFPWDHSQEYFANWTIQFSAVEVTRATANSVRVSSLAPWACKTCTRSFELSIPISQGWFPTQWEGSITGDAQGTQTFCMHSSCFSSLSNLPTHSPGWRQGWTMPSSAHPWCGAQDQIMQGKSLRPGGFCLFNCSFIVLYWVDSFQMIFVKYVCFNDQILRLIQGNS